MLFYPQKLSLTGGIFPLCEQVQAIAHPCLHHEVLRTLWHGFAFRSSHIHFTKTDHFHLLIGQAEALPPDAYEYTLRVTESGIHLRAHSKEGLLHGYMALLDRIRINGANELYIDCCEIAEAPLLTRRMVHYCLFPETPLWEMERFIRLCGALRYTHIVLEFWGSLQYECMRELGWPQAYSKEEITPLIQMARDLGMEIIPMFNHWGHAAASRVMHGKHVVLDQRPALQPLFSDDGWCWDIFNPRVRNLLKSIRQELIALCGPGEYFHIGCDEAYGFDFTDENLTGLCDFINEINDSLIQEGHRAIMWGDMLLCKREDYQTQNRYTCNAPSQKVQEYLLEHLDKRIIMADWQYHAKEAPVETAAVFRQAGFDCLLCPWDENNQNVCACLKTVHAQQLYGFMHTTWHTLTKGMPHVVWAALGGYEDAQKRPFREVRTQAAALLRKVYFVGGDYKKAGWADREIEVLC